MGPPEEEWKRVEFGPDGRLYTVSPDAMVADSIAHEGVFGPRYGFRLDSPTHQGGYHVHLYERGYLTNVCFTRAGPEAIAYTHCEGKSPIKYETLSRSTIRQLVKDGLTGILAKERAWTIDFDPDKEITRFTF